LLIVGKNGSYADPKTIVSIRIANNGVMLGSTRYDIQQGAELHDAMMTGDSTIYMGCGLFTGGSVTDQAVISIDQNNTLLGAWRLTANTGSYASGFSVDADGGFDFLGSLPDNDSLDNGWPCAMERVSGTFVGDCDVTDHPLFTQSPASVTALDAFPLVTLPAPTPISTTPLVFTPSTITMLDPCLTTHITERTSDAISIHPNPADDELRITSHDPGSISRVDLFNALGTLVRSIDGNSIRIAVSDLPRGAYICSITFKDSCSIKKRVILQ
jgi:hypothetical protein